MGPPAEKNFPAILISQIVKSALPLQPVSQAPSAVTLPIS